MAREKRLRTTIIELFKRHTPLDTTDKVYHNGDNNLYPCEIERVINNSTTAKPARGMMAKYIAGRVTYENPVINLKKGYRISDLVNLMSWDLATHGGFFLLVKYGIVNGEIKAVEYDILDYSKCRISEEDDDDNEGMIIYKDYEKQTGKRSKKKEDKIKFMPYTADENVLLSQMGANNPEDFESAVKNFKGNVYFCNPTNYTYPLSPFDPAYNDMDSEYRISLYVNTMTRTGFLGKTLVLTQGLDDEESEQVKRNIEVWLGSENTGGVYHQDVEAAESLDNVIKIIQVGSQFDDDMFENTKKTLRTNILAQANNIPEALVYSSDGAMFGSSGEAYNEMKVFYSEQTESERELIENTLLNVGLSIKLTPLANKDVNAPTVSKDESTTSSAETDEVAVSPETLEAQAALRGSVGGVQGVLGIQQSVSQGLTDVNSAITILMEIYGFTSDVSRALLGQPVIKDTEDGLSTK